MFQWGNYKHKPILLFIITFLISAGFFSCGDSSTSYENKTSYDVVIKATKKSNAPSLQSFAHGISGSDWLLFAGRTNNPVDSLNGGLHNINGNYTYTSFIPSSFNKTVYVYDVIQDQKWEMDWIVFQNALKSNWPNCSSIVDSLLTVFINSNSLITQKDDDLILVGGYGPSPQVDTTFITYNQVAKINIPTLISIVKGIAVSPGESFPIHFGHSGRLISTGGEMYMINDTLYLAGGHNFGANANNFQQYVSAVYPFTIKENGDYGLDVTVYKPISDALDPSNPTEADNSVFRRRDAPIVPSIYYNRDLNVIQQGITFYAGVFQPGSPPRAWNNAIYVTPGNKQNPYFYDSDYGQDNHNVYSCPDFEAYDSNTNLIHTFLLGGIGSGKGHGKDTLSGFTNNSLHIQANIDSLRSRYTLHENTYNSDTLFGAEAAMILNENALKFYTTANGERTEIIELATTFTADTGSVEVGYIYGGISAFTANPQSYGSKKSAASNKIWKVSLTKSLSK